MAIHGHFRNAVLGPCFSTGRRTIKTPVLTAVRPMAIHGHFRNAVLGPCFSTCLYPLLRFCVAVGLAKSV
jgi:hypothetical protein